MRPANIIAVQPVNTATFYAVRWSGADASEDSLRWMADEFGWKINGVFPKMVRGTLRRALVITGRSRKQYTALEGDWIIALGANGSIRICSDRQFRTDYKETQQ